MIIHKFLGRFRSEHLIDPVWERVARGDGVRALEGTGIIPDDRIMACVQERSIHGLCEHLYREQVARHEPGACIPFSLAGNATMVLDVLVASRPELLLQRPGHEGMSLVTFCAISARVETLKHLDSHLHILGSCVSIEDQDQPLYASCYSRLPETTRWLLGHGFDPNQQCENGRGVLHRLSIFNRHEPPPDKRENALKIISLLLEHGADPCIEDAHGQVCINGRGWMCEQIRRMIAEQSRREMNTAVDHNGDTRSGRRF